MASLYTDGMSGSPTSREAELATRLLKFREHRARLLAASRKAALDADETRRRRLIARADREITRIEAALRPKRAYFKTSGASSG